MLDHTEQVYQGSGSGTAQAGRYLSLCHIAPQPRDLAGTVLSEPGADRIAEPKHF